MLDYLFYEFFVKFIYQSGFGCMFLRPTYACTYPINFVFGLTPLHFHSKFTVSYIRTKSAIGHYTICSKSIEEKMVYGMVME
jgi:hypothetical protein